MPHTQDWVVVDGQGRTVALLPLHPYRHGLEESAGKGAQGDQVMAEMEAMEAGALPQAACAADGASPVCGNTTG